MRTFDSGKSDLIKVVSVNQLNKECPSPVPSNLLNRISESHESHESPKGKKVKKISKKGKNQDLIKHNKLIINSEESLLENSLTQSYEEMHH